MKFIVTVYVVTANTENIHIHGAEDLTPLYPPLLPGEGEVVLERGSAPLFVLLPLPSGMGVRGMGIGFI